MKCYDYIERIFLLSQNEVVHISFRERLCLLLVAGGGIGKG